MSAQQESPVPQWRGGATRPSQSRSRPTAQLGQWFGSHRPRYRTTERSWFVMLALVCFGMAVFIAPAAFVALGIGASGIAWWRRESARQGVLNTAFVAFFAGVALLLVSIVLYVFQNL